MLERCWREGGEVRKCQLILFQYTLSKLIVDSVSPPENRDSVGQDSALELDEISRPRLELGPEILEDIPDDFESEGPHATPQGKQKKMVLTSPSLLFPSDHSSIPLVPFPLPLYLCISFPLTLHPLDSSLLRWSSRSAVWNDSVQLWHHLRTC